MSIDRDTTLVDFSTQFLVSLDLRYALTRSFLFKLDVRVNCITQYSLQIQIS